MSTAETNAFAILSTQRTGSSWLGTLLHSHPALEVYGELFYDDGTPRTPFGAGDLNRFAHHEVAASGIRSRRPWRTFAYLDELYRRREGVRAVGFKVMYDQLARHPEVLAYLARRRVRVIHLVRRNLLDVVISREAMAARGYAHGTTDKDARPTQVTLQERLLLARLRKLDGEVEAARRLLRLLRMPHIEVGYDELRAGPEPLARVIRWVGLPQEEVASLTSELVKLNAAPQSELVSNYAAVARRLDGTRYAAFLKG